MTAADRDGLARGMEFDTGCGAGGVLDYPDVAFERAADDSDGRSDGVPVSWSATASSTPATAATPAGSPKTTYKQFFFQNAVCKNVTRNYF